MSNHITLRGTLLAAVLATLAAPALASHSWGGYHWAFKTTPFTLQVGNNMSGTWAGYLLNTVNLWNASGSYPLRVQPVLVTGTASKRNCSMVAGTTQVCNGKYGYNGWLGLASINISGLHITQGSAKMNDTYFNLATYNNPNERLHVVCQEVAHTFGLGHQSETGASLNTCMDYFSNTGSQSSNTASTTPNAHDFEQLNIIYGSGHTTSDGYNSALQSAMPAVANSGVDITDDPRSWGALIHQSANGRSSIYERRNSNGSKTLTHVYWAEETAAGCRGCDHRFETHQQL